MKLLYLALAVVLASRVDGCRVPVNCMDAMYMSGVSLMDCPPINTAGDGNEIVPEQLECCTEVTYTGPPVQHYEFGGGCPVEVEFTVVDLDAGESLIIRNIHCTSDPSQCQMYIIDSSATTPFTLEMSSSRFSFWASGDTVNIIFRVVGPGCDPCVLSCDDGWTEFDDNCYKANNQQKPWAWHQNSCANKGGTIAYGYDQASFDFIAGMTPTFGWSGLHCIDANNTNWYWDTTGGPVVNTIPDIWKTGYPFASINAHCAYFPFNHNGQLENANCGVQRKSLCVKPLV